MGSRIQPAISDFVLFSVKLKNKGDIAIYTKVTAVPLSLYYICTEFATGKISLCEVLLRDLSLPRVMTG
jgi:hypothetical protein